MISLCFWSASNCFCHLHYAVFTESFPGRGSALKASLQKWHLVSDCQNHFHDFSLQVRMFPIISLQTLPAMQSHCALRDSCVPLAIKKLLEKFAFASNHTILKLNSYLEAAHTLWML